MTTEFRQWLVSVVSPERFDSLSEILDLLVTINGTEFQELELVLWSRIGIDDTLTILDRLDSELLVWSIATAVRFGVNFEDSQIEIEQQEQISEILSALIELDMYEIPEDVIRIIDDGDTVIDVFCGLIAMFHHKDAFDYVSLIKDVNPELIKRIRDAAVIRRDMLEEYDVEPSMPTDQLAMFKDVMQKIQLEETDPVRQFFVNVGKLGLPVESYLSVLGYHLQCDDKHLLASRWVWIKYASGGDVDLSQIFELFYGQNVSMIMRLTAAINTVEGMLK